jgi:hypothetical protein
VSASLNNVATADGFDTARTLVAASSTRLVLTVANAAIFYQLGHNWPSVVWDEPVFLPPGYHVRERDCDAVRVRSAVAGKPAQVTLEAATKDDVG